MQVAVLVVPRKEAQSIKSLLKERKLFHGHFGVKILPNSPDCLVPVDEGCLGAAKLLGFPMQVVDWPRSTDRECFKYELYNDFLIVASLFSGDPEEIARKFKVSVVARKNFIAAGDETRKPTLSPLYSSLPIPFSDFWTSTRQNGVTYCWKPACTMFSAGNISEKLRIAAKINAEDEVVLDLYAGIGYFALPFIVHSKARLVIAVDMNEHSIEGLRRGLAENRISQSKIEIYHGRNEEFISRYQSRCNRVNLGLIPSSEQGWPLAILALADSGGILHLHQNIQKGGERQFEEYLLATLGCLFVSLRKEKCTVQVLNVHRVKWYAPRVMHCVFDLLVRPMVQPLE